MSCALSLSRELFVPRELVFDAWTEEEHLAQWYSPCPEDQRTAAVSARPGGHFELAWTDAQGARCIEAGEYLEMTRPEGFSCRVNVSGAGVEAFQTRLTVSLVALSGACRIEIEEDGFPSTGHRDGRLTRWTQQLDQLEAYFSVI